MPFFLILNYTPVLVLSKDITYIIKQLLIKMTRVRHFVELEWTNKMVGTE